MRRRRFSLWLVRWLDRHWVLAFVLALVPLVVGLYLFARNPVSITEWTSSPGAILLVFAWSLALTVLAMKEEFDAISADAGVLDEAGTRELADRRAAMAVFSGTLRWLSTAAILVVGFVALIQREGTPILLDSGFQVIRERITFDFTDWERGPDGVVRAVKEVTVEKVSAGPSTYKIFFGASNRVEVACVTHPSADKKLVGEDQLPASMGLQQGYLFEVDLGHLDPYEADTIRFESRYVGSFQGETEEWAGTFVLYPMTSVVVRLVFPPEIGARNFRVYERRQDRAVDRRLGADEYVVRRSGNAQEWEILSPRIGRLYRVEWEW